jgi:hypothetical protein
MPQMSPNIRYLGDTVWTRVLPVRGRDGYLTEVFAGEVVTLRHDTLHLRVTSPAHWSAGTIAVGYSDVVR